MLQPVSYKTPYFTGHLVIKAANGRKEQTVDDIINLIPNEEERGIFKEELDTFQKNIEELTSDKSNFTLTVGHDVWEAGNVMPYGHGVTFDVRDADNDQIPLYRKTYPITRPQGTMWNVGDGFRKDIKGFLNKIKRTVISKRQLVEARRRASERKY